MYAFGQPKAKALVQLVRSEAFFLIPQKGGVKN